VAGAGTPEELIMATSVPRWQALRRQWAQPTADIHALRRAWGRAVYNRRRQQIAVWRRLRLIDLLSTYGYPCGSSLIGVGGRWLYHRYFEETGASRRTFFSDLAAVRTLYERHSPDGPERGTCACTAYGRSAALQSGAASPAASGRPPSPSPATPYFKRYLAVRLALEQVLPRELVEVVLVHAERLQEALRPPRRLGDQHQRQRQHPHPAAQAARTPPPRPPARPPSDTRPEPEAEVYIWRS
jgi:hypothetical protein